MGKRKRKGSATSDSDSDSGSDESEKEKLADEERRRKEGKKKRTKKKKRRRHSSSSDSGDDQKRKSRLSSKKKKKKESKKSQKNKTSDKRQSDEDEPATIGPLPQLNAVASAEEPPPPSGPSMAPLTKAEWDKRQNHIRRVFDESTGRHRLVRGDGEILEEIVSRDRHRVINKQATLGDGLYFQSKLQKKL